MNESNEEDPKRAVLEAGLLALQEQRATTRCLQTVVKRRGDLDAHGRAVLDSFFRIVDAPGFRPGKAPPELMLSAIAKRRKYERMMFRQCFAYWMELNTGLPERVVDAGRKAAPGIDFETGDWSDIARTAAAIAARMPQQTREDILLALFAMRFGATIAEPCLCEHCAKAVGENGATPINLDASGEIIPPAEVETAEAKPVTTTTDDARTIAPPGSTASDPAADSDAALDPRAQSALSNLRLCVSELEDVDPRSALWDAPLGRVLEELHAVRTEKIAERNARDLRAEIAELLSRLQTPQLADELAFLRLRDVCFGWNVDAISDLAAHTSLCAEIAGLVQEIAAHREARLGAQHAEDDEQLEAFTTKRKSAKASILTCIEAIAPVFRAAHKASSINDTPALSPNAPLTPPLLQPASSAPAEVSPRTVAVDSSPHSAVEADEPGDESANGVRVAILESLNVVPTPRSSDEQQPGAVADFSSGTQPSPNDNVSASVAASSNVPAPARSAEAAPTASEPVSNSSEVAESNRGGSESISSISRPRTSTAELAVTALLELPVELSSYDEFRTHYWTGASQLVDLAPWKEPEFPDRLLLAATASLRAGPSRTWELLTFSRALEMLSVAAPIATVDLRASAALWASPESSSAGLDPDRCERLRSGRALYGSSQQRVALLLEAIRPSLDRQLLPHEIETLIEQSGFESGALRVVVHRFLTATAQGHEPSQLLRRLKKTGGQQAQNVAPRLDAARRDLQALVTRVWNAAGGKVQRTHCRHAWSDFIERIQPSLVRLYPAPRGDDTWSIAEAAKQIDAYASILEDTCERFQAKFDDKRRMLRTANEIADAARQVVDLRREQLSSDDARRPSFALPELELEQLQKQQLARGDEEFARQLLVRAMGTSVAAGELHPLAITIRDLCRRPDLLRVIRDVPPESVEALRLADGAVAYADDLPDPIRAAAILMQPSEDIGAPTLESLVTRLERTQRGALLGLLVQVLDERLQRRIHAERGEALGRLVAAVSRISQVVDDLGHLGNRFASAMRAVRDRARQLIETDDVRLDTRLIEAWLERVHEMGRGIVDRHVEQLKVEASKREDGEEILNALTRCNYSRAIRLLQGHSGSEMRGIRQTEWRDEVEPNRDGLLRTVFALTDAKLKPLLEAWRGGVKGDPVRADRTLRTEFVKLITDGRNMDRDSQPSFVAIPMSSIQAELAHAQLMPTFMPQLSRFARLTVLTPPVSPEQPSFKQAALSKLGEFQRDLVLFLTPRLPAGRRMEILSDMRHRRVAAAVVDDLDLARLLNPGAQRPHQMLGTLEIALEQQRRGMFSPFELPEGSHVKMEMYVGRRDKARELARTANFSRLFSGRKLGKSALLRFMENSEGGVKLPSGNALRVVYVPAVGIESEPAMVEEIVASLERVAVAKVERPREGDPAEKLGHILNGYLANHRTESLLLVLDEADVFFEHQLAEYEKHRERCLSFQMRSRFSALTDEHGLPRVRFVFAGYRVTNRSQGAWSNWGRVLSLDPLEPEDAARLIAGPLAVMGIDVGAHAHEIAYRCGYQPAIILRFGERLVEHLDRQPHRGEHYVVSSSDIAQVLDDPRVHEEIRTIAQNNFEGNPVGLIVFSAFLRELLELPPGQPLRDAPQRIIERLRKIDTDLSWLERDGDGSATVRTYLADFVERSLLRKHRLEGEYSLRFPHHLTILATLADGARIRDELRRVKSSSDASAEFVERALVAPQVLRDLAEGAQANANAIGIVGTLWPTGTYDRSGGIPDRLGATPDETVDAQRILDGMSLGRVRVVRRTDVATAELIVGETQSATIRPTLIGGADLLRWGILRRRASSDVLYEVHGVGRLSTARLAWWFHRVRGLEFARPDALERIHARTGGIPILLETVDSQLLKAAGTTVSDERVNLALDALEDAIPTAARELVTGRPASALLAREREILQMVECVVRADPSAGTDLAAALTELWELFADKCPIPPLSSSDAVSLELLIELGLLPAKTPSSWESPLSRIGPIGPADPVFKIVRAFGSERVPN